MKAVQMYGFCIIKMYNSLFIYLDLFYISSSNYFVILIIRVQIVIF